MPLPCLAKPSHRLKAVCAFCKSLPYIIDLNLLSYADCLFNLRHKMNIKFLDLFKGPSTLPVIFIWNFKKIPLNTASSVTGYFQNARSFESEEAKFKSIMDDTAKQRAQTAFNLCRDFAVQVVMPFFTINHYKGEQDSNLRPSGYEPDSIIYLPLSQKYSPPKPHKPQVG